MFNAYAELGASDHPLGYVQVACRPTSDALQVAAEEGHAVLPHRKRLL